jgi:hypothetical protein
MRTDLDSIRVGAGFKLSGAFGGLESPAVWLSGKEPPDNQTFGDPETYRRAERSQGLPPLASSPPTTHAQL